MSKNIQDIDKNTRGCFIHHGKRRDHYVKTLKDSQTNNLNEMPKNEILEWISLVLLTIVSVALLGVWIIATLNY